MTLPGSDPLAARLAALKPHIHVFGHTHFAWNMELHGRPRRDTVRQQLA